MNTAVKEIKHPYIIMDQKIKGGEPIVAGTGIRVMDIAVRYEFMGMSPEDIIVALPHLNLPQIHDALSYYYEHKNEVDKKWKAAIKSAEAMKKAHPSVLEEKIGKIKDIRR